MLRISFTLFIVLLCTHLKQFQCDDVTKRMRYEEGLSIATALVSTYFDIFTFCLHSSMPDQKFIIDDLYSFVNYPSRTTVGFGPKFTSNRKFFANMITTTAFKEMLAKDEDELQKDMVKKLKFCDEAVMDQDFLKEFYDREVDQSKI